VSEADSLVGQLLADRYRIQALLARGGMARVYRARDERLERDVAVKVLSAPYDTDPGFTARFLHEARSAASLSHPSLVHVYDSGTDEGAHYIVMELLAQHRTLRDELDAHGSLPRDDVLRIGQELLAGLRVVHANGLVHCDVKAGNVMLGPGPAKLIDFGIATPPHAGEAGETTIGSLASMSPEQLHGEALTPASDLYSLGAVLYEALTGRPPFTGTTPEEISNAQEAERVRPPSTLVDGVPGRLDEAILQALRRDPDSRFRSADAMSVALATADDALEAWRTEDTTVIPVQAPSAQPTPSTPPPSDAAVPPAAAPVTTSSRPPPAPSPERGGGTFGRVATAVILAAAVLVVLLVVLPLLDRTRTGGAGDEPTPTPVPTATAVPNDVVVGDYVGQKTKDAIDAAKEAGLDWTVYCDQDPTQPEGIVHQEPPAGTTVARGSTLSLYSARIKDCR
jgi:eukaryotic-like serine/threonine-protein kinase